MKIEKTQQEVIRECANAVLACWNHYSDKPIKCVDEIREALVKVLPESISTHDWQKYADENSKER